MPIGIDDFKELREGYYFVDKSRFIKLLIDGHSKVTLLTRPRRFGKTLTLSMLDWFFSLQKKEMSRHLFRNLDIETAGETYMEQRGGYPVLFVTFKDLKDLTWKQMVNSLRLLISDWCVANDKVMACPAIDPELKQRFLNLKRCQGNLSEMQRSLALLMTLLKTAFGRPVILLIDEYDTPIQQAWEGGFYKECITFMKQLLGSALKGNENLHFSIMTGVLRIAKESIFSDLNNLDVCSVMSDNYADIIGFTAAEVKKMAYDLGKKDALDDIKTWYDGYRFGHCEIYNPWSVINFFRNGQVGDYWVNMSGNGILRILLQRADAERTASLQGLLQGNTETVTLNERVIYSDIGSDKSALYTLLLTTGYLTISQASPIRRNRYELRIPNKEIKDIYGREILNYLAQGLRADNFDDLFDYLFRGDVERFTQSLQHILRQVISTYDAANKESFYHGFMLGMTALFLGSDYTVESNRESGYGRFDLAIFPHDIRRSGVILEFKVAGNENELENKAEEALIQIEKRQYVTAFEKRHIHTVWEYGIAFCGKKFTARSRHE